MELISLIVTLVIAGLLFWLQTWAIDYIGVPEPFNKVIRVLIVLVVVLYLVGILTGYAPRFPVWRH